MSKTGYASEIGCPSLSLSNLRVKVLLKEWWTANGCLEICPELLADPFDSMASNSLLFGKFQAMRYPSLIIDENSLLLTVD